MELSLNGIVIGRVSDYSDYEWDEYDRYSTQAIIYNSEDDEYLTDKQLDKALKAGR